VREREANELAAKASRPTNPRQKHSLKAKRLCKQEKHGALPRLLDLSHNGVMECAAVVRWCGCASDGHPILPLMPQMAVVRGSFLYLFAADGDLLPTTRALSSISLFGATITTVPHYYDERMPTLHHLIHLRLTSAWHGRLTLYLQLRSEAQMRSWASDLGPPPEISPRPPGDRPKIASIAPRSTGARPP